MAASYRTVLHCVTLWLFFTALCFVHGKVRRCQKIKISLCKNIGYNLTYTPNMFNHDTQKEAAQEFYQFLPRVKTKKKLLTRLLNSLSVLYVCPKVRAA